MEKVRKPKKEVKYCPSCQLGGVRRKINERYGLCDYCYDSMKKSDREFQII